MRRHKNADVEYMYPYFHTHARRSQYQHYIKERWRRAGVIDACSGQIGVQTVCSYKGITLFISGVGCQCKVAGVGGSIDGVAPPSAPPSGVSTNLHIDEEIGRCVDVM